MNKEFCDKIRKATLLQYSTGVLNKQTKPQIIINNILNKNNINYINEKTFGYYSVDNYLQDYNLIIEVMGDYFHANPLIYPNYSSLNEIQIKDIVRDKRKHTYILKYFNIEILYIWENDIKTNTDLCESIIIEYINKNGKLDDYNSFNFSLCNQKLKINSNIINPYFIQPPND